MDKKHLDREKFINYAGLASIGIFCYIYSMYTVFFAEKHVFVPVLGFPVFVGVDDAEFFPDLGQRRDKPPALPGRDQTDADQHPGIRLIHPDF